MPPPMRRRAAVTVVAPGEGRLGQFLGSGDERGQRRRRQSPPPADVVMRDASRDDEQDPDAGGSEDVISKRTSQRVRGLSVARSDVSTPEDTNR